MATYQFRRGLFAVQYAGMSEGEVAEALEIRKIGHEGGMPVGAKVDFDEAWRRWEAGERAFLPQLKSEPFFVGLTNGGHAYASTELRTEYVGEIFRKLGLMMGCKLGKSGVNSMRRNAMVAVQKGAERMGFSPDMHAKRLVNHRGGGHKCREVVYEDCSSTTDMGAFMMGRNAEAIEALDSMSTTRVPEVAKLRSARDVGADDPLRIKVVNEDEHRRAIYDALGRYEAARDKAWQALTKQTLESSGAASCVVTMRLSLQEAAASKRVPRTVAVAGCASMVGVSMAEDNVTVVGIVPGSPAAQAEGMHGGFRLGDVITAVDGVELNGRSLLEVMGSADTHVFSVERIQAWMVLDTATAKLTELKKELGRVTRALERVMLMQKREQVYAAGLEALETMPLEEVRQRSKVADVSGLLTAEVIKQFGSGVASRKAVDEAPVKHVSKRTRLGVAGGADAATGEATTILHSRVFVNSLAGLLDKNVELVLSLSDDVAAATTMLEQRTGLPRDVQRLFHDGKQLQPGVSLAAAGVKVDDTLELQLRLRGGGGDGWESSDGEQDTGAKEEGDAGATEEAGGSADEEQGAAAVLWPSESSEMSWTSRLWSGSTDTRGLPSSPSDDGRTWSGRSEFWRDAEVTPLPSPRPGRGLESVKVPTPPPEDAHEEAYRYFRKLEKDDGDAALGFEEQQDELEYFADVDVCVDADGNRVQGRQTTSPKRKHEVVQRPPGEARKRICLFVQGLNGKSTVVTIEAGATVSELMDVIAQKTGVPPFVQRLLYGNLQLEPWMSLRKVGVWKGATVILVLRLRGGVPIAAGSSSLFNTELAEGGTDVDSATEEDGEEADEAGAAVAESQESNVSFTALTGALAAIASAAQQAQQITIDLLSDAGGESEGDAGSEAGGEALAPQAAEAVELEENTVEEETQELGGSSEMALDVGGTDEELVMLRVRLARNLAAMRSALAPEGGADGGGEGASAAAMDVEAAAGAADEGDSVSGGAAREAEAVAQPAHEAAAGAGMAPPIAQAAMAVPAGMPTPNAAQQEVLDVLHSGQSCHTVGGAGTGKTLVEEMWAAQIDEAEGVAAALLVIAPHNVHVDSWKLRSEMNESVFRAVKRNAHVMTASAAFALPMHGKPNPPQMARQMPEKVKALVRKQNFKMIIDERDLLQDVQRDAIGETLSIVRQDCNGDGGAQVAEFGDPFQGEPHPNKAAREFARGWASVGPRRMLTVESAYMKRFPRPIKFLEQVERFGEAEYQQGTADIRFGSASEKARTVRIKRWY
jgi:hypothetical protein